MKKRNFLALIVLFVVGAIAAGSVAQSATKTETGTTATTVTTTKVKLPPPPRPGNHWCPVGAFQIGNLDPSQTVSMDGVGSVTVSGPICQRAGLNQNLEVLLYAGGSGQYYTVGTADIQQGMWSEEVDGIGAESDQIGSTYYIVVLGVSNRCLAAIPPSGTPFTGPPKGCSFFDWHNRAVVKISRDS